MLDVGLTSTNPFSVKARTDEISPNSSLCEHLAPFEVRLSATSARYLPIVIEADVLAVCATLESHAGCAMIAMPRRVTAAPTT